MKPDILDAKAYSIEDEKQKSEDDRLRAAAEKKKDLKRSEIIKLRKQFEALMLENQKDIKGTNTILPWSFALEITTLMLLPHPNRASTQRECLCHRPRVGADLQDSR